MPESHHNTKAGDNAPQDKQARLQEALRANLKRRKAPTKSQKVDASRESSSQ